MNKVRVLVIVILVAFLAVLIWLLFLKEDPLKKQSNKIIKDVELFRLKNDSLPNSLQEIGIEVIDEANPPIYYKRIDSLNFIVWYGTTLGESNVYHSDSQRWEAVFRMLK